jgi:hypothetical protein
MILEEEVMFCFTARQDRDVAVDRPQKSINWQQRTPNRTLRVVRDATFGHIKL